MQSKTCWDPSTGAAASPACTASQWQCQTDLSTGAGSCTGAGTTNSAVYFCGSGANCNNPSGKTCWDPVNGVVASTTCTASQWQCTVRKTDILN